MFLLWDEWYFVIAPNDTRLDLSRRVSQATVGLSSSDVPLIQKLYYFLKLLRKIQNELNLKLILKLIIDKTVVE